MKSDTTVHPAYSTTLVTKPTIPLFNGAFDCSNSSSFTTKTKKENFPVTNLDSDYDKPSGFECPICLEHKPANAIYALNTCGCVFCRKCLESYITTALNLYYDHHLSCPNYDCHGNGKLCESEILSLVPATVYHRYELLKVQRAIDKNSVFTYCPKNNCSTVCRISPPQLSSFQTRDCVDKHSNKETSFHRFYSFLTYERSSSKFRKQFGSEANVSYDRKRVTAKLTRFPVTSSITRPALPVVCPKCGYQFCARCHCVWHTGQPPFPCELTNKQRSNGVCHPFTVFCQQQLSTAKRLFAPCLKTTEFLPSTIRITCNRLSTQRIPPTSETVTTASSVRQLHQPQEELLPVPSFQIVRESARTAHLSQHSAPHTHSSRNHTDGERTTSVKVFKISPMLETDQDLFTCKSKQNFAESPIGFAPYPLDAQYKRCPSCLIPVERADGCAQMFCQSCKRTFCWYCLASLDSDLLLRHFDSGECQGKLGHSRASLLRHRLYVVITMVTFILLAILSAPVVVFIMVYLACRDLYQGERLQHRRRVTEYRFSEYAAGGDGDVGCESERTLFITGKNNYPALHTSSEVPTSLGAVEKDNIERALIHWNTDPAATTANCNTFAVDLESGISTAGASSPNYC